MSAYRYVVFPPGAGPSHTELVAFQRFADHLNHHIAYGVRRGDGGLALACEAEPFDRLRGLDPAFESLLTKWRARGGEVADKLPFVKDGKAWKTYEKNQEKLAAAVAEANSHAGTAPDARSLKKKQLSAREAEGQARIAAAEALARAEAYERAAGWLPYVLWGAGAVMVLAAGAYLGVRLLGAERERRSDTVERIANDAFDESLAPRADGGSEPLEDSE